MIKDEPLGAHCCPTGRGGVGGAASSSTAPCPLPQPVAISWEGRMGSPPPAARTTAAPAAPGLLVWFV